MNCGIIFKQWEFEMTETFTGESTLREWLESNNFQIHPYHGKTINECNWIACRILSNSEVTHVCQSNNRSQITIKPYCFLINDGKFRDVTIEISGEVSDLWYQLSAYSIKLEEVPQKLNDVTQSLIRAWESLI